MARDLSSLQELATMADVMSFLQLDPRDRILMYGQNLGPDDWDGALATSSGGAVLVVRSISAVGASTIAEFIDVLKCEGYPHGAHLGELAIVGDSGSGWAIPAEVQQLLNDAENAKPGCPLARAPGYEDLWMLSAHPQSDPRDFDLNTAKARIEAYSSRTDAAYRAALQSQAPSGSGRLAGKGVATEERES